MSNRGIFSNGPSLAAIDKLMDQLQDAIRNGDNAEAAALQAQIDAVRNQAEQAEQTGQNAREMVLRRDTRLNTLEDVANRFTEIISAAEATHQALRDEIDAIALTPGPAGRDSTVPGPAGASAYDVAREAGYGGSKAQWLASLQGQPGTPADMAVITALATRVSNLETQKVQIEYRDGVAVPAVVSLIGLSATVDVTITWPTAFADTAYVVTPQISTATAGLLGKTGVTLKSKTTTGCVVTVTTTALIAAGQATVSAVAYRKV